MGGSKLESFQQWVEHAVDNRGTVFSPNLESPLEAIFFVWWNALAGPSRPWYKKFVLLTQQEVDVAGMHFRLDFVIGLTREYAEGFAGDGLAWPLIAVEVDGHGFHEKTPEQVANRNQRDRVLQQAGWFVFHFSWSELTTRPVECVGEVFDVVRAHWQRLMVDGGRKRAAESAAANQEAPTLAD